MLFEPYGVVLGIGNAICCLRIIDLNSFPQESVNVDFQWQEGRLERWKCTSNATVRGGPCMRPDGRSHKPLCHTIIFLV